jgi:hypothetical protein
VSQGSTIRWCGGPGSRGGPTPMRKALAHVAALPPAPARRTSAVPGTPSKDRNLTTTLSPSDYDAAWALAERSGVRLTIWMRDVVSARIRDRRRVARAPRCKEPGEKLIGFAAPEVVRLVRARAVDEFGGRLSVSAFIASIIHEALVERGAVPA